MAVVHDVPADESRLARALTTDFCPWANRFVYWLKEPVGWFVLATAIAVIVGLYVSSVGWILAASLTSLIVVGMAWPWIAVRAVACSMKPEVDQVHEGDPCELKLSVRNKLPLPVWGLAVEGFLDRARGAEEGQSIPTVALAFVRGLSTCTYRFSICPELRGRYPVEKSTLTCSFPFGIWTARRTMQDIAPVTVWPKVFPITGQNAMAGRQSAEHGEGNRSGRTGDFIGIREYRHGDCLKQINWIATARSGDLVVTERSGPQCPSMQVVVDDGNAQSVDEIADRIRVAASILANLHEASVPMSVQIGSRRFHVRRGREGFVQMMDALADIPLSGGCLHENVRSIASKHLHHNLIGRQWRPDCLCCRPRRQPSLA